VLRRQAVPTVEVFGEVDSPCMMANAVCLDDHSLVWIDEVGSG